MTPNSWRSRGANANSAQGALIEHEDYLCMAFRGTDELGDWLDNINAFSTEVLFGKFHRGFWFRFVDAVDGALAAATEKGIDGIEGPRYGTLPCSH